MNNTTIIQDNTTVHHTWLLSLVLVWARFYIALPLFVTSWAHFMNWGNVLNKFEAHSFTILPSFLSDLMGMTPMTISSDIAAYLTIFGGLIIAIMVLIGLFGRFFSFVITLIVTLILFSRLVSEHSGTIHDALAGLVGFLIPVLDFVRLIADSLGQSLILEMWTPSVLDEVLIILGLILMFIGFGRVSLDHLLSEQK